MTFRSQPDNKYAVFIMEEALFHLLKMPVMVTVNG